MDEPLSNLDAKLRLEMRAEIRRIHRELGRATIYVTHDQDEALSLADRIIVMKDGVVQQIAVPAEIYAQPANLDVARFMGYRNVLELDVMKASGSAVVVGRNGLRLEGVAKQAVRRRAVAAIRPEDFMVENSTVNLIDGRIEAVEYCGRDSLVDVRTASGVLLHARMPASAAAGEAVRISVPPERVLVYPAEGA
jgi:putative spermidine/putrescine transport system ATP-binding protein